jgi:AcrR family transcriptional regulator
MANERGGATLRQGVTDAITAATFAELADSGYARMSMDAVARRAGVGKAALYRRWNSKEAMLVDLIGQAVRDNLPPIPDTGALRSDLRAMFATYRAQLSHPLVGRIGASLLAEAAQGGTLGQALQREIAVPRREAALTVLQAAIERGELPAELDIELGMDLLMAPLAFRLLIMRGAAGDAYLDTLSRSIEAALRAAA